MEKVTVDWQNHRVEGNAVAALERGLDSYFSAPLLSHIVDNLWVGGCVQDVRLDDDFVKVVSLYPWEQFALGPETERVEIKMLDSSVGVDWSDLDRAIAEVQMGVERGKTLVHCQAGLNRSNLVAAGYLMSTGMRAEEAIALLREKRSPLVLCNQTFERQLFEIQEGMDNASEEVLQVIGNL